LIVGCVVLIGAFSLMLRLSRPPGRHGSGVGGVATLGFVFALLDLFVILRFARPVAAAVTKRLNPASAGRLVLGTLAVLALILSVVVFGFATCFVAAGGF
jgi:hypothetical protein